MNISELRNESTKIANQARALLDAITPENRSEKEAEFERMMADSDAYALRAKNAERAENRSREFDGIATDVPASHVTVEARGEANDEQRAAEFQRYLRGEIRAQSIANDTGTKGGVLVPTTVEAMIVKAMKDYGPFTEGGPAYFLQTSTGNSINVPYSDNTAGTATVKVENAAGVAKDKVITSIPLTVATYDSGLFQVSNELARDAIYNIQNFVVETCAENLGYKANAVHTANLLAATTAGKTATAAAAVSARELLELAYSVGAPYRRGGGYMFNSKTELAIRLLTDNDGKYLWQAGLASDKPATIHGFAYHVNDDMPDLGANAKAIAYGRFDKFWVRRAGQIEIKRSDDLLMAENATAFIGFMSTGSALTDAKAVKHLVMAAS